MFFPEMSLTLPPPFSTLRSLPSPYFLPTFSLLGIFPEGYIRSSRKLTGRKPSLQLIMALLGFFIQPS